MHVSGDVAGSVEAIMDTLATFHSKICDLTVIDCGVGDITENDMELSRTFGGIVSGVKGCDSKNVQTLKVATNETTTLLYLYFTVK